MKTEDLQRLIKKIREAFAYTPPEQEILLEQKIALLLEEAFELGYQAREDL